MVYTEVECAVIEYLEIIEKALPYTVGNGAPSYRMHSDGQIYTVNELAEIVKQISKDYNVSIYESDIVHDFDTSG